MQDLSVLMTKLTGIAGHWNLLGVQLKFLPETLKAFSPDIQAEPIKALQELLTRWLQRTAPPPMLESLAEAVGGPVIGNELLAGTLLTGRADLPSAQAREPDHCKKTRKRTEIRNRYGNELVPKHLYDFLLVVLVWGLG